MKVGGLVWLGLVWWDVKLNVRIFFILHLVSKLSKTRKHLV